MNRINVNKIGNELSEIFGINFGVSYGSEIIEIRPTDLEYGEGFLLKLKFEWRKLTAEFIPDNFSAALVKAMELSEIEKKELFKLLVTKCKTSYDLTMKINGIVVNPLEPKNWGYNWSNIKIKISKMPIILDEINNNEIEGAILNISRSLLAIVLSLLPLEETVFEESNVGMPEGAVTRIEVNRYERSAYNREACIAIQGCICKICNFNFESRYGSIGMGFIHVHHIVPVSQLGPGYSINPATDLVPLCPNCHAMVHKRNPPFSVEELKSIISSNTTVG